MSSAVSRSHMIYTIAVIGFIYTLHIVLPMYSNSSFLSLFADERTVGLIYMAGAVVSILAYLISPYIIRRFGNYATSIGLICIQIGLFWGIISSDSASAIATFFILQAAVVSLIGLSLDIFLETYTDGHHVGTIRGLYTTVLNASWLIGPLLGGMLINGTDNYRDTYIAALAMLFPLLYLIHRNFPKFKDPTYMHLSPWQLIKHISSNKNWVKLFSANIILQTFYAWMVIYSPIYLHSTIGFSWEEIGIIFTIMLIPFPLIQYELGKLADKKYGEKEIMALGFFVMGIATIALSLIDSPSVLVWALALFTTRLGAAAIEIMIEVYFFKTVPTRDTATLGMFRITRPISNFIAPVITGAALIFTTHGNLFAVIGVIALLGLYPALTIKDTK
ncbi:MAG: MFS transporter [Candidatus Pacebacteria bacterium]|nr:MFS transporter [Candidatus Paceibacterota bacterium]